MKTFLLFAIAFVVAGLTTAQSVGQVATSQSPPQIVAKVFFPNESGSIPTTTLVTPQKPSVYRITVFWETTALGTSGLMCGSLNWTDYSPLVVGSAGLPCIAVATNAHRQGYGYGGTNGGTETYVIQAKPYTPVTFSTSPARGFRVSGSPEYALSIIVEDLTP
jgi:hypothetical protein